VHPHDGGHAAGDRGSPPRAEYEIYYDQLLAKGRGSPLWIPGPSRTLPTEYRRSGVRIGDVGIIYRSGKFNFLFNIFLSANHPINRGRVPETFYHLDFSKIANDLDEDDAFGPDSYLTSSSLRKTGNLDSSYVLAQGNANLFG